MPSSSFDNDPPRPARPWPDDVSNRRQATERRHYGAQSAFAAESRPDKPSSSQSAGSPREAMNPGGGNSAQASASPADGFAAAPSAQDSRDFSPRVYDQQQAAGRTVNAPDAGWTPGRRSEDFGIERRQFRRHTDWRGHPQDDPGAPPGDQAEPAPGDPAQHNPFDPDYRQWRDEQMRQLDRDYAQWRRERYEQFSLEFSRWRSQKSAAAAAAAQSAHPTRTPAKAASLDHASALSPAPPNTTSSKPAAADMAAQHSAASDPMNAINAVSPLDPLDPLALVPGTDRAGTADHTRDRSSTRPSLEDRKTNRDHPGRGSSGGLLSSLLGGHSQPKK